MIVKDSPDRYKWWVVVMLWFVCLFNYADRQAINAVFPQIGTEMKLNKVQQGLIGGAFMWVYALALPLAGVVGDRYRRKTLIIVGLIFWSLITIATALSRSFAHLYLFRALEGLGEAFYFPASMSLISDYHGRRTRSRAMSFHQSSVYAGTIAGGAVAGYCGQYYGWRSGFYLFGCLGVVLGVVLTGLLREPKRGASEEFEPSPVIDPVIVPARPASAVLQDLRDVFRSPMVPILIAVFMGANFVAAIFLTWMPTFLKEKFGMGLAMAGLNGTAWSQIASMLGAICGGILADRVARRHRGGRMMTQALGLLAGIPFIFLTGWTLSFPILVVAMVGFGFFKGIYDANIWASLYDVVEPRLRATALGLMNAIAWIGAAVAPPAIALASERYGMSACLSATSLIYLLFGLLLIFGIRAHMRTPEVALADHA